MNVVRRRFLNALLVGGGWMGLRTEVLAQEPFTLIVNRMLNLPAKCTLGYLGIKLGANKERQLRGGPGI